MQRLVAAYEKKKTTEYRDLFTGDFQYEFSNSTDPILVSKYAGGWFKIDEAASATNLFQGGTGQSGEYLAAATSIDINLTSDVPIDDASSPDPEKYKVLGTRIDGNIVVPTTPDPTTYVLNDNFNRWFLVRGDAAQGLSTSQPADAQHWYFYKWQDETQQVAVPVKIGTAAQTTTWGKVKALYR